MKHFAANALSIIIVLLLAAAGAAGYAKSQFEAAGPLAEDVIFEVPRGASLEAISNTLYENGVIESASLFRIGAKYAGVAERLRFGEYEIPAGVSMREALDILVSGRAVQHLVTIPEGLTSWEAMQIVAAEDLLTGETPPPPPEGSIAPQTYSFARGDSRASVVAQMTALQERILAEEWAARPADLTGIDSPEEALILASIIEKETGIGGERPMVSGVFHNRLAKGMKLQSDPTIIYGITEGVGAFDRPLRRSDISGRTDWNTYVIDALPPTPIANPGRAAIRAALNPDSHEYIYFVADGTGGHAFAVTLAEHNANVAEWRAIERARAQGE